MNFEQLKKNVGAVVRIHPVAHRKDEHEVQLPDVDDDWIIDAVVQDGIRVSNIRTGHTTLLAKDHIHHYTSDPERSKGGQKRGFLTLLVQVTISGAGLKVDPLRRPGEALPRKSATIRDRFVDLNYPSDAGMVDRLRAVGYRLTWCKESRLTRAIDIDGWQLIIQRDANGVFWRFRVKDRPEDHILLKKPI